MDSPIAVDLYSHSTLIAEWLPGRARFAPEHPGKGLEHYSTVSSSSH